MTRPTIAIFSAQIFCFTKTLIISDQSKRLPRAKCAINTNILQDLAERENDDTMKISIHDYVIIVISKIVAYTNLKLNCGLTNASRQQFQCTNKTTTSLTVTVLNSISKGLRNNYSGRMRSFRDQEPLSEQND
uniref:Uncharacterized protein n=1 Tax=Glossina pallidipes TaxID=7398 RepID=A0A1A9ZWW0_GLOPL